MGTSCAPAPMSWARSPFAWSSSGWASCWVSPARKGAAVRVGKRPSLKIHLIAGACLLAAGARSAPALAQSTCLDAGVPALDAGVLAYNGGYLASAFRDLRTAAACGNSDAQV